MAGLKMLTTLILHSKKKKKNLRELMLGLLDFGFYMTADVFKL